MTITGIIPDGGTRSRQQRQALAAARDTLARLDEMAAQHGYPFACGYAQGTLERLTAAFTEEGDAK